MINKGGCFKIYIADWIPKKNTNTVDLEHKVMIKSQNGFG